MTGDVLKAHPGKASRAHARNAALACLGLALVILVIFNQRPDLDIAISQWFFTLKPCDEVQIVWGSNTEAKRCGEFAYEHSETWRGIRVALKNLTYVAGFGALIWFVWSLRSAKHGGRNGLFLPSVALASLIAGPLLIINLFKEISGRSRPIHSLEFGGFEPFTAAGDFS